MSLLYLDCWRGRKSGAIKVYVKAEAVDSGGQFPSLRLLHVQVAQVTSCWPLPLPNHLGPQGWVVVVAPQIDGHPDGCLLHLLQAPLVQCD